MNLEFHKSFLCPVVAVLLGAVLSGCGGTSENLTLPPAVPANHSMLLGVNADTIESNAVLMDALKGGKVVGARTTFYWDASQPNGPADPVTYYSDQVHVATAHGIPVLGIIAYSARWASSNPTEPSRAAIYWPPTDYSAFAEYARLLVRQYPEVTAWEVWNEPNADDFWRPAADAHQYAELLKQTYTAIKQERPDATVVLGGLSCYDGPGYVDPEVFLSTLYQDQIQNYFDVLGFHPYSRQNHDPDNYLLLTIQGVRAVMEQHGDAAKKIWITETGWYTGSSAGAISEQAQAVCLREMLNMAGGLPYVERVYVYELRDSSADATDPAMNYGLFYFDGAPKSATNVFLLAEP